MLIPLERATDMARQHQQHGRRRGGLLFAVAAAAAGLSIASATSVTSQTPAKSLEAERQALEQWSAKVSAHGVFGVGEEEG